MDQICWGVHVNTEEESLRLPEQKVEKIRILLRDPAYDTGNTQVALRDVQVLRGTLNFATIACPPLLPELGPLNVSDAGDWGPVRCSLCLPRFADFVTGGSRF